MNRISFGKTQTVILRFHFKNSEAVSVLAQGIVQFSGWLNHASEKGALRIYFVRCFLFFFNSFIYFWLRWVLVAACGLFSSCSEQGLLFIVVRGLLIAVASLVAEHGL